jgi:hypothetical protein
MPHSMEVGRIAGSREPWVPFDQELKVHHGRSLALVACEPYAHALDRATVEGIVNLSRGGMLARSVAR